MQSSNPANVDDLESLDTYLSSETAPDNCLQLSDLDGFMTALVVGPRLVKPSEWLPLIWGGEEPSFESEEHGLQVVGAIMARYNEIVAALGGNPPDLEPIFWEGPDGQVIAADWAQGFINGVSLDADSWAELMQDEDTGHLMLPILALVVDDDGEPVLEGEEGELERLQADAPALIAGAVMGIAEFWRERRGG